MQNKNAKIKGRKKGGIVQHFISKITSG